MSVKTNRAERTCTAGVVCCADKSRDKKYHGKKLSLLKVVSGFHAHAMISTTMLNKNHKWVAFSMLFKIFFYINVLYLTLYNVSYYSKIYLSTFKSFIYVKLRFNHHCALADIKMKGHLRFWNIYYSLNVDCILITAAAILWFSLLVLLWKS